MTTFTVLGYSSRSGFPLYLQSAFEFTAMGDEQLVEQKGSPSIGKFFCTLLDECARISTVI
ncbi:MAG: hypothetical protein ICV63_06950 [Coleofasciculus sp. Co-bin14]|nr:hypothetical protein [Coleofasciculus sp. Co-bin14]